MTAEHEIHGDGFILAGSEISTPSGRTRTTVREVLALASIELGLTWAYTTPGTVWTPPRRKFESTLYGVGNHTISRVIFFKWAIDGARGIVLTKLGREILEAVRDLKDARVVAISRPPHPLAAQPPAGVTP